MQWLNLGNTKTDTKITTPNFVPKLTLKEAGSDAIDKIVESYPSPYYLMCSGGVDSQSLAYLWKLSGHPFQCISFLYTDNKGLIYNTHDIDTFQIFANLHNISYKTKFFNYWAFLEKDLEEIAEKYNCASPQITAYIAMSDMIQDGTVIFSGNFFLPKKPPFDYDILALYRYSLECATHSVIPFFFSYTPDLAFIGNTFKEVNVYDNYKSKCNIYRHYNIPIIEQNTKLSGFELIKDSFDTVPNLISKQDRLRYSSKPSKRPFDIAYRYKLRDKLGPHPKITIF